MDLGNAALGASNLAFVPGNTVLVNNDAVYQASLSGGRTLNLYIDTSDYSSSPTGDFVWSAFGYWSILSSTNLAQNNSQFVAGWTTAYSSIPTTGSADYNGFIKGGVLKPNASGGYRSASLLGDANLHVDWASGAVSGGAPSILATPAGSVQTQAWNSLTFAGTMTSGVNGFTGTTQVTSAPGNSMSLLGSATGTIAGQFYGDSAQEVGALWNLHDATSGASGVLVAK